MKKLIPIISMVFWMVACHKGGVLTAPDNEITKTVTETVTQTVDGNPSMSANDVTCYACGSSNECKPVPTNDASCAGYYSESTCGGLCVQQPPLLPPPPPSPATISCYSCEDSTGTCNAVTVVSTTCGQGLFGDASSCDTACPFTPSPTPPPTVTGPRCSMANGSWMPNNLHVIASAKLGDVRPGSSEIFDNIEDHILRSASGFYDPISSDDRLEFGMKFTEARAADASPGFNGMIFVATSSPDKLEAKKSMFEDRVDDWVSSSNDVRRAAGVAESAGFAGNTEIRGVSFKKYQDLLGVCDDSNIDGRIDINTECMLSVDLFYLGVVEGSNLVVAGTQNIIEGFLGNMQGAQNANITGDNIYDVYSSQPDSSLCGAVKMPFAINLMQSAITDDLRVWFGDGSVITAADIGATLDLTGDEQGLALRLYLLGTSRPDVKLELTISKEIAPHLDIETIGDYLSDGCRRGTLRCKCGDSGVGACEGALQCKNQPSGGRWQAMCVEAGALNQRCRNDGTCNTGLVCRGASPSDTCVTP